MPAPDTDAHLRAAGDLVVLRGPQLRRLCAALAVLYRPLWMWSSTAIALAVILALAPTAFAWSTFQGARGLPQAAVILALAALGLLLHELGHASAAYRSGRGSRSIGLTLAYGFVPAVFIDLEPATRQVARAAALRTELAGCHLQLLYAATLMGVGRLLPGAAVADAAAALTLVLAGWQLLPLPGQDGAHILRHLWPRRGLANTRRHR